jgi:magnesium chelatase family protein
MYSRIRTAFLNGICGLPVSVEVDVSPGLPAFEMVGNLAPEVKEAKERVKTGLHNSGIMLPAKRITVNLSPGNLHKSGTGFDLPIAIALLAAMGVVDEEKCENTLFIGELNLNGGLLPVKGILPIVCDAKEQGIERFVVPRECHEEAMLVKEIQVFSFEKITEVVSFLKGEMFYEAPEFNIEEKQTEGPRIDFADVNGQKLLRRACEVAAAGMHNLLMIGPPGAGKTMLSERMATILPPLTEAEMLEISKIYSVSGKMAKAHDLIRERPFRSPHHTVTGIGLAGGGTNPRPGEISLAHTGVLFLDELPEFSRQTIEILRQPMEEHSITIVRGSNSVTYPAGFLLLAAMNPCNCGYYPDMQKCRCTPQLRRRYFQKISQPILDRIDICVEAAPLTYDELTTNGENESSEDIRARVVRCQEIERERYRTENFFFNSRIPGSKIKQYCALGDKEEKFMEDVYKKEELTGRSFHKILRVARTIADLDESEEIGMKHLREAVCYRSISERYWGGV